MNYSLKLLSQDYEIQHKPDDIRVFYKFLEGDQKTIGTWISQSVPILKEMYGVTENREIAILYRKKGMGNHIGENLSLPFKPSITTPLDTNTSLWGGLFRKILNWAYSIEVTKFELVEDTFGYTDSIVTRQIMTLLGEMEEEIRDDPLQIKQCQSKFLNLARLIFPRF